MDDEKTETTLSLRAVYQPNDAAWEREKYADSQENMRFYEEDYELVGYLNPEAFLKHVRPSLFAKGVVDWLPGKTPLGHFILDCPFEF